MAKDRTQEEALKRALKFLGYRSRSEAEVTAKLAQHGFTGKTIQTTLQRLRDLNLLNDESFAWNWVRQRVTNRGYGPVRLAMELRRKGISQSLIGRIIGETFAGQESKERAKALIAKKFRGKDLTDAKTLRRAVAFLQRRGYRDTTISEIVRQPLDD